ncbi:MAG: sigma-70 family RNA polymerase sigma factor [Phototrophicaceae bacterium]|nr:ECF RNA polymerase sigma factor SigK [Anaerolineae bacterium]GIK27250.1 MAG: RNA polymerase [Chloroflexota bacterium]
MDLSDRPMRLEVAELLKRIAHGDDSALAVLFAQYGTRVYSLILYVVHDEALAQEATQDTFIKVWNNPQAWDASKGQFHSWLLTLARYTAIDLLRREVRANGRDIALFEELQADRDESAAAVEADELRALLNDLPAEQRDVIRLAYFRGLKHSELAARLNLPLGTVKTRLRLGLHKLRAMLSDKS